MNLEKKANLSSKRATGEFFTSVEIGTYVATKLLTLLEPKLIIEPYAGEGDLLTVFIEKGITCVANDINKNNVSTLKNKFKKEQVKVTEEDVIEAEKSKLLKEWMIGTNKNSFLIYTNPPFGTISTNQLASKKNENNNSLSRNIHINYKNLEQYGKGDLILPALGKLIEIFKNVKTGYFAFYSPVGLFCRRKRFNKLLDALLKDFKYLYGEIFSGDKFENVNKKKPICVTFWEYQENGQTSINSLRFNYNNKIIPLKETALLKDYWRYDTRKYIQGELVVQGNDRFNVMAPKMIHLKVEKGGSELIPENLIKPLNLGFLPDELAIGLWSVIVGHRSLTNYPIYVDNAYVHLPDFNQEEFQQLLVLAFCSILISEQVNNYTKGKISIDTEGNITFGNTNLTKGIHYLINKYNDLKIQDTTLGSIIDSIKQRHYLEQNYKELKKSLKNKMELILLNTDYWNFIPLPSNKEIK